MKLTNKQMNVLTNSITDKVYEALKEKNEKLKKSKTYKDKIKGSTLRKIKIGEKEQRNIKIIKKRIFLEIEVDKIEFKEDI